MVVPTQLEREDSRFCVEIPQLAQSAGDFGLESEPRLGKELMSIHTFISPKDVKSARHVLVWARNYLMKEHEEIHRPYFPQKVCPFVKTSINANCLYMVFHNEFNGRDAVAIANQVLEYAKPFKEAPPISPNERMLKALLIVFPNIEDELMTVLDKCHRMIKPKIVQLGLMVGQFHPRCCERAVHNHRWNAVSRSPVPLMALRNMVIHDIMFLGDNEDTFKSYDEQFGVYFVQGGKSLRQYQKHLIAYYQRAKSKHPRAENHQRKT
jgi:heptaprenyl diphosphate synthase